jgi:hypothetical protein
MGNGHSLQPAGTPVEEGRKLLEEAHYKRVFGINTTQNRGELWMRGNEMTQFIPFVDLRGELFLTEKLNQVLKIPLPQ